MHCQIIDALHTGTVPMSKVNFGAKSEPEYINNYKVLQSVFDKLGIDKQIDVNKLIKARPVDNLEFLQWMKHYYDTKTINGFAAPEYSPVERREKAKGGSSFNRSVVSASSSSLSSRSGTGSTSSSTTRTSRPGSAAGGNGSVSNASSGNDSSSRTLRHSNTTSSNTNTSSSRQIPGMQRSASHKETSLGHGMTLGGDNQKVKELEMRVEELKMQADRYQTEADFYYNKLQDIEQLCQRQGLRSEPFVKVVEAVLYHQEGRPDLDACVAQAFSSHRNRPTNTAASAPESFSVIASENAEANEAASANAPPAQAEDANASSLFDDNACAAERQRDPEVRIGASETPNTASNVQNQPAALQDQQAPREENGDSVTSAGPSEEHRHNAPAAYPEGFADDRENQNPQLHGRSEKWHDNQRMSKRSLSADFSSAGLHLDNVDGIQGLVDENGGSSPTAALQGEAPPSMPPKVEPLTERFAEATDDVSELAEEGQSRLNNISSAEQS